MNNINPTFEPFPWLPLLLSFGEQIPPSPLVTLPYFKTTELITQVTDIPTTGVDILGATGTIPQELAGRSGADIFILSSTPITITDFNYEQDQIAISRNWLSSDNYEISFIPIERSDPSEFGAPDITDTQIYLSFAQEEPQLIATLQGVHPWVINPRMFVERERFLEISIGKLWAKGVNSTEPKLLDNYLDNDPILDVVVDPSDNQIVYTVDRDNIYRSQDGGESWADITNNLLATNNVDLPINKFGTEDLPTYRHRRLTFDDSLSSEPLFTSLEISAAQKLLVGTQKGIFALTNPAQIESDRGNWQPWGLQDMVVKDLLVDGDGILLAATNKGFWSYGSDFNSAIYGASNPDLIQAFGYNLAAFQYHYDLYGRYENRNLSSFDPFSYLAAYSDLQEAYGLNPEAVTQHYIEFGHGENRSAQAFDAARYAAGYLDLITGFVNSGFVNVEAEDFRYLSLHYLEYGQKEGRDPLLFKPDIYIASYPDLIKELGYDLEAATEHYLGIGYQANPDWNLFNPQSYLNLYPDLKTAYGDNTIAATWHYINYGYEEGRVGIV